MKQKQKNVFKRKQSNNTELQQTAIIIEEDKKQLVTEESVLKLPKIASALRTPKINFENSSKLMQQMNRELSSSMNL